MALPHKIKRYFTPDHSALYSLGEVKMTSLHELVRVIGVRRCHVVMLRS